LNDRAADIWKPLLAVARQLGSYSALLELACLAFEMGRDREAAERQRVRGLLQSLRKLVNGDGAVVGTTSDLVSHLERDAFRVPDHALHDMLARWGFVQQSVRVQGRPRRAWVLPDAKLKEIETRAAACLAKRGWLREQEHRALTTLRREGDSLKFTFESSRRRCTIPCKF